MVCLRWHRFCSWPKLELSLDMLLKRSLITWGGSVFAVSRDPGHVAFHAPLLSKPKVSKTRWTGQSLCFCNLKGYPKWEKKVRTLRYSYPWATSGVPARPNSCQWDQVVRPYSDNKRKGQALLMVTRGAARCVNWSHAKKERGSWHINEGAHTTILSKISKKNKNRQQ